MTTQVVKIYDAAAGLQARSDAYDSLQERTLRCPSYHGVGAATPGPDPAPSDAVDPANGGHLQDGPGGVSRFFVHNTTLLTASKLMVIDSSIDWRDRFVCLQRLHVLTSINDLPGGSSDTNMGSAAVYAAWASSLWYTGTGAAKAAGGNPTDGNPPTTGYVRGLLDFTAFPSPANLLLYVETASPYRLCAYSESGATPKALILWLEASSKLGKR